MMRLKNLFSIVTGVSRKSYIKTFFLLATLTSLLVLIGALFGGRTGIFVMLFFSFMMNFSAYWFSDQWVLKLYKAEKVDAYSSPKLHDLITDVSRRAGLPMPAVYVIQQSIPNAFATGRDPEHAAVAVTSGLLQLLNREELLGVLAHEISHIQNRDTLTMSIAATIAGAIGHVANMFWWFGSSRRSEEGDSHPGVSIAVAILGPVLATMVQLTVSRTREFEADKQAAKILQDARGLIAALQKLEQHAQLHQMSAAAENPATAHLFIINPIRQLKIGQLFSTHPSTEDRIAALRAMTSF